MCNGKLGRLMEKKSRGRGFVEEILEAELEFSNSWERGNIFPFFRRGSGEYIFRTHREQQLKIKSEGSTVSEERRRQRSEPKKLTSDRETPARPIKGNDIFIIEINCSLTARSLPRNPRVIKGGMAALDKVEILRRMEKLTYTYIFRNISFEIDHFLPILIPSYVYIHREREREMEKFLLDLES